MVSSGPNQIHIYNPVTKSDVALNLSAAPNAVSISPNGRFAAVGHNNLISYVDLANTTVQKTLTVAVNVTELVLGAEYVYLPPTMSVRISDGVITSPLFSGQAVLAGRLGADGALYIHEYSQLVRRAVSGATVGTATTAVGGNCYYYPTRRFHLAGTRIYDGCGSVWNTPDLKYATTLSNTGESSGSLVNVVTNATRGVAAIPTQTTYNSVPQKDNEVLLYAAAFPFAFQGRLVVPDFVAGNQSFQAHGKWLFYDSTGSNLYVINQADAASGLLNDYAIFQIALPLTSSCSTSLSPSSLTAPASGSYLSVSVTSAANCGYTASTTASWLALHAPTGAGTTTLTMLARPNLTGGSRTGSVTIGSETFTVTQAALGATTPAFQPLSFRVRQAEYSKSRERLILTTANPNELHIYDPLTRADQVVALPFVPLSLALSPDGSTAGVGGDGAIVFVNLSAATAGAVFPTQANVLSLVLPGNGYGYVFSTRGMVTGIDIATGTLAAGTQTAPGPARLVTPGNRYAYASSSSGYGITKWDVATPGSPTYVGLPAGNSDSSYCYSNFWLAEDGNRLFTPCGRAYRTSEALSTDLTFNGQFSGLEGQVLWLAHSLANKVNALTLQSGYYPYSGASEVRLYGDEFLSYLGKTQIPDFDTDGTSYKSAGRFLFWNSAGDRLFVVASAQSANSSTPLNVSPDHAVYTIAAANNCATPGSPTTASFAIDGGSGQIAVTATCPWRATSSAAWLTITSGGFGLGAASLNYSVSRNDSGATRSATISFGAQTYTVTQSTGTLTLTPSASSFGAVGGTATLAVTSSSSSLAWTAATATPWIQITSGASGTGNGTVGYSVAPNAASTTRTGIITVGGVTFTVTQAGTSGTVQVNQSYFYLDGNGGSGTATVTATGTWIVVANDSWIRITTPSSGTSTGNGTIAFTVDRNPNPSTRTGTITVNGQTLQVYQYEAPATFAVDPMSINIGAAGGSGTIQVTSSSPNGYWSSYSNATWVIASASRSGSGPLAYTVSANTSTIARSATIFVNTLTITVNQAGLSPAPPPLTSGLHFVPVTPCRIADTRENLGAFGKPALAGGSARSFVVSQAPCNIPSNAKAYSMNVTVVPKGPLGYITIWPTGQTQPFVSTLNSVDGRVKANAAIVPAGSSGAVSVVATDATELIMDINGYFIEPNLNPTALAFYPIRPCRIADTRDPNGSLGGPRIDAGGTRSFPVLSASCGIPSTARAYSMNATVVPSGSLGYISMWPTGQPQPFVSTLNAPTGAIVANAAIVPAGTAGAVSVFAQGQTHLVLDVNGYFAPPGSADAQRFYAITPCRLVDTREGTGSLGGPVMGLSDVRSYPLSAANCGLPSTARAYSLNATVVPTTILGYMTLWPTGQSQPFVSTLNVTDDRIVANAAIVPVGTGGAVSSYVTNQTHLILDTNGYFAQ